METPNTFGSDSAESTLENIDTNTPLGGSVQASEPSEQRTVADFYRGIAEQVADDTADQIVEHSQKLHDLDTKQQEIDEQQQDVGFFDIKTKIGLNKEQREVSTQQRDATQKLQDLKSPAEELLDVSTTSDVEVARTLDPRRLEELARANEPLYGQEASVRVADLTPEQVAERRQKVEEQREARMQGEGYTMPLPEDNRTEEQKQEDFKNEFESALEKSKEIAIEILVTRLTSYCEQTNEAHQNALSEGFIPWNMNPEAWKLFSELAYDEVDGVMHSDAEKGFWGLKGEVDEIERSTQPLSSSEQNNADYIKSRMEKLEVLEGRILTLISNWQMANEIAEAAGVETITPEDFLENIKRIEARWPKEDRRLEYFLKQSSRYRNATEEIDNRVIESMYPGGGNKVSIARLGTYPEGIVQEISDICGKSPLKLSRENIPTIIAYFNVAVEQGIEPANYRSLTAGIEMALRHTLINSSVEGSEINNIDDLVKQIRGEDIYSRLTPQERYRLMGAILKPYYHSHIFTARKFKLFDELRQY